MSIAHARRGHRVKCPNCGAEIIVGSGKAGQKVKCPKCTAPMPVEPAQPQAESSQPSQPQASVTTGSNGRGEQQLAAAMERIERLEARIVELERRREQPQPAPVSQPEQPIGPAAEPTQALLPELETRPAESKLKWVRSPEQAQIEPRVLIPDAMHEQALVHNLRVLAGSEIIIRSASGNLHARQRAERFKELFTQAEWKVRGVSDTPVTPDTRGLALAAGSLPPTRGTTRTFLAFTAAGFELESRLDMSLHSDETMLIVA
jgi:predicted Zn finger-like uncharacterized protein